MLSTVNELQLFICLLFGIYIYTYIYIYIYIYIYAHIQKHEHTKKLVNSE